MSKISEETREAKGARKRTWIDPEITRMRATDAEAGSNPGSPEGFFATAS